MSIIQGKWEDELYSEFTKPYYKELYKVCSTDKDGSPQPAVVFDTLATLPLEDVKVAVIYDVCEDCHLRLEKLQKSDFELFHALAGEAEPQHFYVEQNVLLYNVSQFYTRGNLFDRTPIGFYKFATAVVKTLSRQTRPLVILLLGNSVYKYKDYFYNPEHLVLTAPLSSSSILVNRSNQALDSSSVKILGGQPILQRCNRFLIKSNLTPIQWSKEDVQCTHTVQS